MKVDFVGDSQESTNSIFREFSMRELWGGIAEVDIAEDWGDVATLRQVPDHQEVFAHSSVNKSIIFEILQMDSKADPKDPIRFFFDDLAKDNDAQDAKIIRTEWLSKENSPFLSHVRQEAIGQVCEGVQNVPKTGEAADLLTVTLLLFRLPTTETDILIQLNNVPREEADLLFRTFRLRNEEALQ